MEMWSQLSLEIEKHECEHLVGASLCFPRRSWSRCLCRRCLMRLQDTLHLPVIEATAENFAPYGQVISGCVPSLPHLLGASWFSCGVVTATPPVLACCVRPQQGHFRPGTHNSLLLPC